MKKPFLDSSDRWHIRRNTLAGQGAMFSLRWEQLKREWRRVMMRQMMQISWMRCVIKWILKFEK